MAALLGIKAQVTSEEIGQSPLPAFSTSEEEWPQPATTQLLPQSNTTKSTNSRREVLFLFKKTNSNMKRVKLGLVVDPVIEAIARLEFEDGMRTGVLLGGHWGP